MIFMEKVIDFFLRTRYTVFMVQNGSKMEFWGRR